MVAEMGLMIPIMALAIPFFAIWTKHQRRLAEINALARPHAAEAEQNAAQTRRLRDLEERVKVLERIITDGRQSAGLAQEIEALRHN